jgi:RimJ/RimL family protein N-acetyltransferase
MTTPDVTWPRPAGSLTLRPATDSDIDQALTWRNEPAVTRWLIRTEVDPGEFRKDMLDGVGNPNDHSAVADLGGVIVGIGFLEIGNGLGQPGSDVWRGTQGLLGYMIDPRYAGRGFATAITRALLHLSFTELGLRRVTAGCFADNVASWRVMEKAGMRREEHGVQDSWHAELGWVDGYSYAILAEQWLAVDRTADGTPASA